MTDLTIPQAIVVVVMLVLGMASAFLSGYSHGLKSRTKAKP